MNNEYYYCCSLPLEPGSIIKPGNWGRIIKTYTPQASPNSWLLVRELIFEKVRQENFPDKPSRFDSIFLCFSENDIKEFRNSNNRFLDVIYKVELVDQNRPTHTADYTLANIQQNDNFSTFVEKAKKYWEGEEISKAELVTTSRIRIKSMII